MNSSKLFKRKFPPLILALLVVGLFAVRPVSSFAFTSPYTTSATVLTGLNFPTPLGSNGKGAIIFTNLAGPANINLEIFDPESNTVGSIASYTDPSANTANPVQPDIGFLVQDESGNLYYALYFSTNLEQIIEQRLGVNGYSSPIVLYQDMNGTAINSLAINKENGTLYFIENLPSTELINMIPSGSGTVLTLLDQPLNTIGSIGELIYSSNNLYFSGCSGTTLIGSICTTNTILQGASIFDLNLFTKTITTVASMSANHPTDYLALGPDGVNWAFREMPNITAGTLGAVTNGIIFPSFPSFSLGSSVTEKSIQIAADSFPISYGIGFWASLGNSMMQVSSTGNIFEIFSPFQWVNVRPDGTPSFFPMANNYDPAEISWLNPYTGKYTTIFSGNVFTNPWFPFFTLDSYGNLFYSSMSGTSIEEIFAS